MLFQDAMKAMDLAFMFTDGDLKTVHLLLLVKARQHFLPYSLLPYGVQAVTLFNAYQHEEAMLRVQELADACPNADTHACRVVEVSITQAHVPTKFVNFAYQAYLCVQLGIKALDDARHNEAADHFNTAINSGAFSSEQPIYSKYKCLRLVRWNYFATKHCFPCPNCVRRPALRVGPAVLMANCEPETVLCTPLAGRLAKLTKHTVHDGYE